MVQFLLLRDPVLPAVPKAHLYTSHVHQFSSLFSNQVYKFFVPHSWITVPDESTRSNEDFIVKFFSPVKPCSEYALDSLDVLSILNFFIKTLIEFSASCELLACFILIE